MTKHVNLTKIILYLQVRVGWRFYSEYPIRNKKEKRNIIIQFQNFKL